MVEVPVALVCLSLAVTLIIFSIIFVLKSFSKKPEVTTKKEEVKKEKKREDAECPLAVIGMGCRMAKGINTPQEFLEALKKKTDFIEPCPKNRWNKEYFRDKNNVFGKLVQSDGGWMSPFFDFDYECFAFNKKEATAMDPQQKICLEVALETFEDANVKSKGSKTGVFIGAGSVDYILYTNMNRFYLDELLPLGSGLSILSNRLSHKLDLQGPSVTMDTACSSSGYAMYVAQQAIRSGDCDQALVGGIHILFHPIMSVGQSRLGVASKKGRCRSFTKDADGYVRSEACGMVLVKSLEKAKKDGDYIYGIIRSTKANSGGGRAPSLSMPAAKAQQEVLRAALKNAKVRPEEIYYVETHGTGTKVGDPIELNGISRVLCRKARKDVLRVGSVKSNLGHTEFAAYVVSLIKCMVMLDNNILVPNCHFKDNINPKIKIKGKNLKIMQKCEPIPKELKEVFFALSSYGIGGSNVCSILERYQKQEKKKEVVGKDYEAPYLYLFSGQTVDGLNARVEQFKKYSEEIKDEKKLMYTLNTWKLQDYRHKTFAIGNNLKDAKVYQPIRSKDETAPVCFVFSGQGPQHYHMGRSLYASFKVYKETIDKCDKIYKELSGESMIKDVGLFGEEIEGMDQKKVYNIQYTLPAIIFFQIGTFELYKSFGIVPEVVVGHSFGEISALYASGQVSLRQALKITHTRCVLMKEFDKQGQMIAVKCEREELDKVMRKINKRGEPKKLWIAAINSPTFFSLGGKPEEIKRVEEICKKRKIFHRVLRITNAYHTPLLECAREKSIPAFRECLKGIEKGAAKRSPIKMFSTVTNKILEDDVTAEYLFSNIVRPVNFSPTVAKIITKNNKFMFYEVSCHPVLASFMEENEGIGGTFFSVKRPRRGEKYNKNFEKVVLYENIGKFCCTNVVELNWNAVMDQPNMERISYLPRYPFCRKVNLFKEHIFNENFRLAPFHKPRLSLLTEKLIAPGNQWRAMLSTKTFPWAVDHQVQNAIVFPAAGMTEMFLEYFQKRYIKNMVINCAIPVPDDKSYTIVHVKQKGKGAEIFFKRDALKENWQIAAYAEPFEEDDKPSNREYQFTNDELLKCCTRKQSKERFYKRCKVLNLQYGPTFQLIEELYLGDEECLCTMNISRVKRRKKFYIHPAIFDNVIQTIIASADTLSETFIPTSIESFELFKNDLPKEFQVHSQITGRGEDSIVGEIVGFEKDSNLLLFRLKGLKCTKLQSQKESARVDFVGIDWQNLEFPKIDYKKGLKKLDSKEKTWNEIASKFDVVHSYIAQNIKADLKELKQIKFKKSDIAKERYVNWMYKFVESVKINNKTIEENEKIIEKMPDFFIDGELIKRCAKNFKALVLNKGNEVSNILFGDDLMNRFYSESIISYPYIEMAKDVMQNIIKQLETKRIVRILEFGSGTGGLSKKMFEMIEEMGIEDRIEYYFTDVSNYFFKEAEKKFKDKKYIRYKLFDLNKTFSEQHYPSTGFDFCIGYDGVHPCEQIQPALENINSILVPNGVFLMMELTNVPQYIHFIFGLFKEWFGYTDNRSGKMAACLMKDEWTQYLEEKGFTTPEFIGAEGHPHSLVLCNKKQSLHLVERTNERKIIDCQNLAMDEILKECQELIKLPEDKRPDLIFITRNAQYPDPKNISFLKSGLVGLFRTLNIEFPSWRMKYFDFEMETTEEEMKLVIDTIFSFPNIKEMEFKIRDQKIYVPKLIPAAKMIDMKKEEDQKEYKDIKVFNENTTYVISGGLGALATKLFEWMIKKQGAKYVVLLSRSGRTNKNQRRLFKECKENFGANILVSKTDILDKEAVAKMYNHIDELQWPFKKGIIHSAMVLRDAPTISMSKKDFNLTYNTKVLGARNLVESLSKEEIEFALLFSSVTAALGNLNQVNYAAGNATIEAYTYQLVKQGVKARTINFPLIDGIGGVANDEVLRELFESTGWLKRVTNETHCFEWIRNALLLDQVHLLPIGSWTLQTIGENYGITARMSHVDLLIDEKKKSQGTQEFNLEFLIGLVAELIESDPNDLDVNEKLLVYGVDSLLSVELSNELNSYGVAVSQMEILSGISIKGIMEKAKKKYGDIDSEEKKEKKPEKKPLAAMVEKKKPASSGLTQPEPKKEEQPKEQPKEEETKKGRMVGGFEMVDDEDEELEDDDGYVKPKYDIDVNSKLIEVQTKFDYQDVQNIIFGYAEESKLFNLHGNLCGGDLKVKYKGEMIDLIDFGACAYLSTGELPELKKLVLKTFEEYGANSHSNAYYEPILVEEILENFGKVVGNPNVRLCLSTTLGNMDFIPSICELHKNNCIIIVDQYAHNTLIRGIKLCDNSIPVRYCKQLDTTMVEQYCQDYPDKTIVYVNDGLYSMEGPNGIGVDAKHLYSLCEKYDNLEMYIDEAHGFGWTGKHGRGYFMSQIPRLHERMTVICSLRKAVSGYGSFAVFGSKEKMEALKYRTPSWFFQTGNNPTAYSLQLAQSRFLLSPEYEERRKYVAELIEFRNKKVKELGLETMFGFENPSPLATLKVPVSTVKGVLEYFNKLYYHKDYRYYVGIIIYPSCKLGDVGLRYTTRYCHSKEQVGTFLTKLKQLNDEFEKRNL